MAARRQRKPESVVMQKLYDLLEPFPAEKAARIVDLVMMFREVGLEPGTHIAKLLGGLEPDVCTHVMTWMQGRFGKPAPNAYALVEHRDLGGGSPTFVPDPSKPLPRDIGRQPTERVA